MKQVAMLAEKRKAEEDRLLAALTAPLPTSSGQPAEGAGPLGMAFHKGRPVAAIVIFRCGRLLEMKALCQWCFRIRQLAAVYECSAIAGCI